MEKYYEISVADVYGRDYDYYIETYKDDPDFDFEFTGAFEPPIKFQFYLNMDGLAAYATEDSEHKEPRLILKKKTPKINEKKLRKIVFQEVRNPFGGCHYYRKYPGHSVPMIYQPWFVYCGWIPYACREEE